MFYVFIPDCLDLIFQYLNNPNKAYYHSHLHQSFCANINITHIIVAIAIDLWQEKSRNQLEQKVTDSKSYSIQTYT